MTLGQYARQKCSDLGLSAETIEQIIEDIDNSTLIDRDDTGFGSWQEKWEHWRQIVDQIIDAAVEKSKNGNEEPEKAEGKTEENTERD